MVQSTLKLELHRSHFTEKEAMQEQLVNEFLPQNVVIVLDRVVSIGKVAERGVYQLELLLNVLLLILSEVQDLALPVSPLLFLLFLEFLLLLFFL